VSYQPQPDSPNSVDVLCDNTGRGKAIAAYLSPFDAMIDAAQSSRPGRLYHVVPAHEFDPSEFIADHDNQLRLALHLGWAALDQKLILRPRGEPAACSTMQEQHVLAEDLDHIEFNIKKAISDAFDRLREHAGLFTYRETFRDILGWSEQRRHQAVAKAIVSIPGTLSSFTDWNRVALYDPEFEQWHFVSSTLLDDLSD